MNLEDQFLKYFGSADIASVSPDALAAGTERMKVDLGLESERGHRFALWAVLHMLDAAPDLASTFAEEADRDAARNFMDIADAMKSGD